MNIVKKIKFGDIEGYQLGYGPIGKPLMSVFLYVIDGIVIDSGQSHMRRYIVEQLRGKSLEQLLLTHHHEDHSGNAAAIGNALGIPIFGHPLTVKKMRKRFRIQPYQHIIWGRSQPASLLPLPTIIQSNRYRFRPIHTPGHSKDHTVFIVESEGWLFSGDLYLGDRIKYFRSDENIATQITSLKTILNYQFDSLFCAHNPAQTGAREHLKRKLDYLENICGTVRELGEKGLSENEIVQKMDKGNDRWVKCITLGNASFANMIRSAIQSATVT